MFQAFVDRHCAALAGVERAQPFGPDTVVWRVHGHMFAAYTQDGQGLSLRAAKAVITTAVPDLGARRPAPFQTGGGWIIVPWETPPDELRVRINESYRLVKRDWPNAIPRRSVENAETDRG